MNKLKKTRFFSLGRKWVFTLALFLFVFAAASAVKIHAGTSDSGSGWLGGWSEDGAGNYTGVGWISMNNTNRGGSIDYGVKIPSTNDPVTGYAWMNAGGEPDNGLQNGIGWIDFNPQDHCTTGTPDPLKQQYQAASCDPASDPGLNCGKGVARVTGINLQGCARIVSIAQATVGSNSGGWHGWIKLKGTASDGHEYGVTMNNDGSGTFCKPDAANTYVVNGKNECHAWSSELGWIDFSWAKYTAPCTPVAGVCGPARSATYCAGSSAPASGLCGTDSILVTGSMSGAAPWSWKCVDSTCPGLETLCPTVISSTQDGKCGSADGGSFCSNTPTDAEMCTGGTHPAPSSLDLNTYEVKWICTGVCSSVNDDDCSAKGKKSCGWIETNP